MKIPLILTDRLNQQVKHDPAFAARIEESTGLSADCREEHQSIGIGYESSNEESC